MGLHNPIYRVTIEYTDHLGLHHRRAFKNQFAARQFYTQATRKNLKPRIVSCLFVPITSERRNEKPS